MTMKTTRSGRVKRTDKHGRPNKTGGRSNPFHYVLAKRAS
jgi:hypothetical protein